MQSTEEGEHNGQGVDSQCQECAHSHEDSFLGFRSYEHSWDAPWWIHALKAFLYISAWASAYGAGIIWFTQTLIPCQS